MVTTLLLSLVGVWLLLNLSVGRLFLAPNRYSSGFSLMVSSLRALASGGIYSWLFVSLILSLLVLNLVGNIPGVTSPSMIYFFSASASLSLWVALMGVVSLTQAKTFLAHMLPFGAPGALALLLPLIEIFSHLIRPFTLMIRLSTNLSSGHIMLYMFSFFSLSSGLLTLTLSLALVALLLLEVGISLLQAYIFTSLTLLYISETL